MSDELIAILGVGIALAGAILATQRYPRADLRAKIAGPCKAATQNFTAGNNRIDELSQSMQEQFTELRREIGNLRERIAHLERRREAISGRRDAA
ncbi:MAG: hypothetical protein OYH76_11710 [Defluviicoccus sp.]|nr:hypothetical protein [Defluviicoccus sp.]MDE0276552.1 hypothetical protein [Defluviicoccus sp.]